MAEHLVTSETPEEIGDIVADNFKSGETYVHLKQLTFVKSATLKRNRQMLAVCKRVGTLEQVNFDPMAAIERLDRNSEPARPKKHFHTSGASLSNPEKIVSYWNGQPVDSGDSIDILPMNRAIEHMSHSRDPNMQLVLERLQEKLEIEVGMGVADPIFNPNTGVLRFDKDVIDVRDLNRVDLFFRLITEEQQRIDALKTQQTTDELHLADSIELGGGDAIFLKNDEALHRRRLSKAQNGLTFRVLIDTALNPSLRGVEEVVSVGPYL